jgi:hypothetical protein
VLLIRKIQDYKERLLQKSRVKVQTTVIVDYMELVICSRCWWWLEKQQLQGVPSENWKSTAGEWIWWRDMLQPLYKGR